MRNFTLHQLCLDVFLLAGETNLLLTFSIDGVRDGSVFSLVSRKPKMCGRLRE